MHPIQVTMFGVPAIKQMADDQKPAYRVNTLGPGSCSLIELLSALIGGEMQVELASAIVARWPTAVELKAATVSNLISIRGVGGATAARIRAAFELGRLVTTVPLCERPWISSPADAAALVKYEMSTLAQEELWVLVTDIRQRLVSIEKVYRGSVNMTQVRASEIFRAAIQGNYPSILIVHNHPSGDPTPSPDDVALTRSLTQAGNLLDISIIDHIVIGGNRFVSLKERGLGFS